MTTTSTSDLRSLQVKVKGTGTFGLNRSEMRGLCWSSPRPAVLMSCILWFVAFVHLLCFPFFKSCSFICLLICFLGQGSIWIGSTTFSPISPYFSSCCPSSPSPLQELTWHAQTHPDDILATTSPILVSRVSDIVTTGLEWDWRNPLFY